MENNNTKEEDKNGVMKVWSFAYYWTSVGINLNKTVMMLTVITKATTKMTKICIVKDEKKMRKRLQMVH